MQADSQSNDFLPAVLAIGNRFASLSALVYDPASGRVTLRCSAFVHAQNADWVIPFFCAAVAIQAADSLHLNGWFKQLGEEYVDASPHPQNGWRSEPDEMLSVNDTFTLSGQGPSRFSAADFARTLNMEPHPWVMANSSLGNLTAEFPFSGQQAALHQSLYRTPGERPKNVQTALFEANALAKHPRLGSGLLLLLHLPIMVKGEAGAAKILDLNAAETRAWTRSHFFGAWCMGEANSPAFAAFVPSALYKPELLDALVWSMAMRAKWAREYLQ